MRSPRSSGLLLLLVQICGFVFGENLPTPSNIIDGTRRDVSVSDNRNGWVNPEDLPAMPQCVAQQDQTTWLDAMTRCTHVQCTRHFGIICTRHEWLTQLSCLSVELSPAVVDAYFAYCSRSVLAIAQLHRWIWAVTGRPWLVHVGDTNKLQVLSPASLRAGHEKEEVLHYAPPCLIQSISAVPAGAFERIMASCGFTATPEDTGNRVRPWEYSNARHLIVPLNYVTASYDLTGTTLERGNYFDRHCLCSTFTMTPESEPCSATEAVDLTRERLWMNATCGSASLPPNWTADLRTTQFDYISVREWHWPRCVIDVPQGVKQLADQCQTQACDVEPAGYGDVVPSIDRTCFCRGIDYDSCGASCHIFESRIDYVYWLHAVCGAVPGWQGLKHAWPRLTVPTPLDNMPWQWDAALSRGKWSNRPLPPNIGHVERRCSSIQWKLALVAAFNIAGVLISLIIRVRAYFADLLRRQSPLTIVTLVVLLHCLVQLWNVSTMMNIAGFEDATVEELVHLCWRMPRLPWLTLVPMVMSSHRSRNSFSFLLWTEIVLQTLSLFSTLNIVRYGWQHNFYLGLMQRLGDSPAAQAMYAGALLSLGLTMLFVWLLYDERRWRGSIKIHATSGTGTHGDETREETIYGTFSGVKDTKRAAHQAWINLHAMIAVNTLLCLTQWLCWGGFIGLVLEGFCCPQTGLLTVVSIAIPSAVGLIIYCGGDMHSNIGGDYA